MKTRFDWPAFILAISFFAALAIFSAANMLHLVALAALAFISVYGFMGLISKLDKGHENK
jgi:predicted DNA repair protein MutK